MPTVVVPSASAGAMARQLASSHSAISRGVPSTSTVPERSARAVSASPTTISASPRKPVATVTAGRLTPSTGRHGRARPAERATGSVDRVIDHDVLERVLSTAMRSGGEFAEVYAEDKRSTSAGLDDGRVEQVTSGRDRGAGIRVVAGETTGFAHTSDLSASAACWPPPRPPRRPPARAAAAPARWR